ncbi:hypothetical protein E3O55_13265 [Cryobacterium sp. MDB1-18-2]|uniref:Pr6Pr family membrane protein n=1 Tax=unclassified Cryobacterium TaxID=2649013 RepID=UPI001069F67F|nr:MULTISPECIES: Pr6Pr family membrane protein [unclassified Cryobacterium]TFC26725.1 hypothetical protein E3O55_13265 [Cryobacterium sp. MDB1-18-2]TFC46479.1 hypothetical protein E3O50_00870 [Cryobacterium sp. MDB1-18-1]
MCARADRPARTDDPAGSLAAVLLARPGSARRSLMRLGRRSPDRSPFHSPLHSPLHSPRRRIVGIVRLVLAGAEVLALLGYFGYILGFKSFIVYNYFSYFTVQSAIAAVGVFIAAGIVALRREVDPPWLDWIRLLVTTYMIVSGIVFLAIVIQSSSRAYTMEVPWSTQLLHFWIPGIALVDWLTDTGKARLPWTTLAWVMVVPSIWGAFTLIRGALVRWYPYFFLDPKQVSGPLETVLYCVVAVALFTGIAAMLTWSSRGWRGLKPQG